MQWESTARVASAAPWSPLCSTPQTCPCQLGTIELLTGDLPWIFRVLKKRNDLFSTPTNSVPGNQALLLMEGHLCRERACGF